LSLQRRAAGTAAVLVARCTCVQSARCTVSVPKDGWWRSSGDAHQNAPPEPPLAHNLNSLRAWWQQPVRARVVCPAQRSKPGPRSNSPVKTTVSRWRSTDAATVQAYWADRPSQALRGEQAGRDRAASLRPILGQLCTQASLLHIQPPTTKVSICTTGQRHSRSVVEPHRWPYLPRQSTPGERGRGSETAEQLLFSWRPPTTPSIVHRHSSELTTSLCAGVPRQT
jgi:hypothetical protein